MVSSNLRFLFLVTVLSSVLLCVNGGYHPHVPSPQQLSLPYLGLRGHKFFIPNPNAPKDAGKNDNILVRNHKRMKAVAIYFRNLLGGNPALHYKLNMVLDPEEARQKWRPEYIRKFGYRGERLVEFLGSGPTKEQILWSLGTVY